MKRNSNREIKDNRKLRGGKRDERIKRNGKRPAEAKKQGEAPKTGKRHLMTVKSTQSFLPIRDIRNGIILTKDGRFVKILEFAPINYTLKSPEEKRKIIQLFSAVIKNMPTTVQIKIVSQRTDVSRFLKHIDNDIRKEDNPKCRELQVQQKNLIMDVGHSVSHRFFIIFERESEGLFEKRPSFEEIAAEMNRQSNMVISTLQACGNELLSNNTNEYIISVLYMIMSKRESEYKSFKSRELEVVSRYADLEGVDLDGEGAYIPINDFIAPGVIDASQSPNYVVVDGLYYTYYYLPSDAYPLYAYGGWMEILIDSYEGVNIDFWIHRESKESVRRKLYLGLRTKKSKSYNSDDTNMDSDELNNSIQAGYYIKSSLANGEDMYYMSTIIEITGPSLDNIKWKAKQIKEICLQNDLKIRPCYFQAKEMFLSSFPVCKYNKRVFNKSKRNILTSSLASSYPFTSFELADENGILLGLNTLNNSPVFVDIFDTSQYNNANMTIMGSTGAGKTYTLLSMLLRMREKGIPINIIAPVKGHEFARACEAIGGQFITLAAGSPHNINIMEIRKEDLSRQKKLDRASGEISILSKKIQNIHTFFSLLLTDMDFDEKEALDEALINTYKKFGITTDNESLNDPDNPGKYKKMPILGDLHEELALMGKSGRRLHKALTKFVTGSAKSFNQQTNVDLNNKFIVADVSNLSDELLPVGMFIALECFWDKARQDITEKKVIAIDEAWVLLSSSGSKQTAEFMLEIFKLIRGYGGAAIAATQDIKDFFALDNGRFGQAIINNSKIKILMKAEGREIERVAEEIDLTSAEVEAMKRVKRKGTCLLVANTNHLFIDIKASDVEHDLITTDRKDLRRIADEKEFVRG